MCKSCHLFGALNLTSRTFFKSPKPTPNSSLKTCRPSVVLWGYKMILGWLTAQSWNLTFWLGRKEHGPLVCFQIFVTDFLRFSGVFDRKAAETCNLSIHSLTRAVRLKDFYDTHGCAWDLPKEVGGLGREDAFGIVFLVFFNEHWCFSKVFWTVGFKFKTIMPSSLLWLRECIRYKAF